MNTQDFGLKLSDISLIQNVFKKYPAIDSVIIYGSRAMGNYRANSDIDLSIKAQSLTTQDLLKIAHEIDELMLIYKVDISLFNQLDNPTLIEHIQRVGKVFFKV